MNIPMYWQIWTNPMVPSAIPSIETEMVRQSQDCGQDNFICSSCKNYKGSLSCERYCFIAFDGANTSGCRWYRYGKKCPHCGRII